MQLGAREKKGEHCFGLEEDRVSEEGVAEVSKVPVRVMTRWSDDAQLV